MPARFDYSAGTFEEIRIKKSKKEKE